MSLYNGQALANGHYRAIGYTSIPGPTSTGTYVGTVVEIAPPTGSGPADTLGSVVLQWTTPSGLFLRVLPQDDGTAYVAGTGINSLGNQRYYAKLGGLGLPAPAPDLCARPPRFTQPPTFQPVPGRTDSLRFALDPAATLAGPRYGVVSRLTWDFGDGSPPADGWQVGHAFASPAPVRVRVCATNNLWCQTCTDLYPFGPLSLRDELAARLSVYPNPSATGVFSVRLDQLPGALLTVTDGVGRPLWQAPATAAETRLDLSHQPAGLYLLRLTWPDGRSITRKLLR